MVKPCCSIVSVKSIVAAQVGRTHPVDDQRHTAPLDLDIPVEGRARRRTTGTAALSSHPAAPRPAAAGRRDLPGRAARGHLDRGCLGQADGLSHRGAGQLDGSGRLRGRSSGLLAEGQATATCSAATRGVPCDYMLRVPALSSRRSGPPDLRPVDPDRNGMQTGRRRSADERAVSGKGRAVARAVETVGP